MNQGKICGYINAGCLVFIPTECTERQKKDVLDITLYTQLAASKKYSPFANPSNWRLTWLAALSRFGWSQRTHEAFSLPASHLAAGTVWVWISSHLPSFMPAAVLAQCQGVASRSVSTFSEQPAVEMLARHVIDPLGSGAQPTAHVQRDVRLKLALYTPTSGLSLIVLSFKTWQPLGRDFLVDVLEPSEVIGNVDMTFYAVSPIEVVYAQFRQKLSDALEDRRADNLGKLREVTHG